MKVVAGTIIAIIVAVLAMNEFMDFHDRHPWRASAIAFLMFGCAMVFVFKKDGAK